DVAPAHAPERWPEARPGPAARRCRRPAAGRPIGAARVGLPPPAPARQFRAGADDVAASVRAGRAASPSGAAGAASAPTVRALAQRPPVAAPAADGRRTGHASMDRLPGGAPPRALRRTRVVPGTPANPA